MFTDSLCTTPYSSYDVEVTRTISEGFEPPASLLHHMDEYDAAVSLKMAILSLVVFTHICTVVLCCATVFCGLFKGEFCITFASAGISC